MEHQESIELIEIKKEKTPIRALEDIWKRKESSVSPCLETTYYAALTVALISAIPSGYPYWPIGEKLLSAAFKWNMLNPYVRYSADFLGGSSAITNSLFNIWVMDRYMQRLLKPESAERKTIHANARNWKTWTKLILLHIESLFAVLAMGYVSLQEENFEVDFWFVDSVLIGFFIAYANLDPFLDSIAWSIDKMYEKYSRYMNNEEQQKNLPKAIQRYFSALHKMQRANNFKSTDLSNISAYIDKESGVSILDIFPYLPGLIFAGATFMGRYGLMDKAYYASQFLVSSLLKIPGSSVFFSPVVWISTVLAISPNIGFGIKSSNTFGAFVYKSFSKMINRYMGHPTVDAEDSVAMQTHPYITWSLLLFLLVPVLGSFAGNAFLSVQALNGTSNLTSEKDAEVTGYQMWWWYCFVASIVAPILSNGFGVFALSEDVVGRFTNTDYANQERFYVDYERLLAEALNGNNKSAIELLIYRPELINFLKKDFGINEDYLKSIASSARFTDTEKEIMMEYISSNTEIELKNIIAFDRYFCKLFGLEYKSEVANITVDIYDINAQDKIERNPLIQSKMLKGSKSGFFPSCCGCGDEDTDDFKKNTSINAEKASYSSSVSTTSSPSLTPYYTPENSEPMPRRNLGSTLNTETNRPRSNSLSSI